MVADSIVPLTDVSARVSPEERSSKLTSEEVTQT
jgi:hypothetical protein